MSPKTVVFTSISHANVLLLLYNFCGLQVAGNIIPALATTTSLVAGLVTQELIKLAQERVRFKRILKNGPIEKQAITTETKMPGAKLHTPDADAPKTNILSPKTATKKPATQPALSTAHRWFRWSRSTSAIIPTSPASSPAASSTAGIKTRTASDSKLTKPLSRDLPRWYLLQHKDRILKRFRNGFVNLARPMLAFAEPVEAETDNLFTQWDSIEVFINRYVSFHLVTTNV